jgi:glycine/D-amino acid oxidase-like deaminating enzyme
VGSGASGRNGGFALRGGADAYDVTRAHLGRDAAVLLWSLTERYVDRMEALAGDAFARTGSLRLAFDEAEHADLEREYSALREDGFDAGWLRDSAPELRGRFPAALEHPADGRLHPGRWLRRLSTRAAEAGAVFVEHRRVESVDELDAEHVVVATDGYTRGLLPELDEVVRPIRNQVVATVPLPRQLYSRPYYGRRGYDYWQQLEDGRLVVGGRRDADPQAEETAVEGLTPKVQAALESLLVELLDEVPPITHRWSGIFGVTPDRMPLAGRLPTRDRVWVAAGYSGHGNVLGLTCGELVARAILGDPDPALALFDPGRLIQVSSSTGS